MGRFLALLAASLLLGGGGASAAPGGVGDGDPATVRRAAAAAYLRGDDRAAVRRIDEAMKQGPLSQGLALLQAAAQRRLGRPGRALEALRRAPTTGLLGDHVAFARAELLFALGQLERAATLADQALRRRDSIHAAPALLLRADALSIAGRHAELLAHNRRVHRQLPRYSGRSRLRLQEAMAHLALGRAERGRELLRRILTDHPASPAAREAAHTLGRLQPQVPAARWFAPPVQLRRAKALARFGLPRALGLLDDLGRPAAANANGKTPARAIPRSELTVTRARTLMRRYRYREAIGVLDAAAKLGGRAAFFARRALPTALERGDRLERLLKLYEGRVPRAVLRGRGRVGGKLRSALQSVARVRFLRGDYAEARRLSDRVPGADPYGGILGGYLAYRAGDAKAAIARLRRLAAREKGLLRSGARYWLARTLIASGQTARGLRILARQADAARIDFYRLMARGYLAALVRPSTARDRPVVRGKPAAPAPGSTLRSVAPVARFRRPPDGPPDDLAHRLAPYRGRYPRLRRAIALLRHGLRGAARRELRWVARRYLLATRPGASLRPVAAALVWRGIEPRGSRRARAAGAQGARGPAAQPSVGLEGALWRAFRALDDPYMANRFARKAAGRRRIVLGMPFPDLVARYARRRGLAASLLFAVIKRESAFCETVVSHANAIGLMQIIPRTAWRIAAARGDDHFRLEQLYDAEVSIRYGSWYLAKLVQRYRGQVALALAAYNGGPHNVDNWLRRKKKLGLDQFIEEIPVTETRRYVKAILANAARYALILGESHAHFARVHLDPNPRPGVIDF